MRNTKNSTRELFLKTMYRITPISRAGRGDMSLGGAANRYQLNRISGVLKSVVQNEKIMRERQLTSPDTNLWLLVVTGNAYQMLLSSAIETQEMNACITSLNF